MKSLVFIIVIVLWPPIYISSQVLVDDSKVWSTGQFFSYDGSPLKSYFTKFQGDTVINSINYYKVLKSRDENQELWENSGFVREEGKRVFHKPSLESPEIILYDFNLGVGDSVCIQEVGCLTVDSIVLKTVEYETRNFFYLSSNIYPEFPPVVWVEGVGSLSGIMNHTGNIGLVGGTNVLLCCTENEILKYSNPEYNTCYFKNHTSFSPIRKQKNRIRLFPNPTSGSFFINMGNNETKDLIIKIFDNKGQLLFYQQFKKKQEIEIKDTGLKPGVYLIQILGEEINYNKKIAFIND